MVTVCETIGLCFYCCSGDDVTLDFGRTDVAFFYVQNIFNNINTIITTQKKKRLTNIEKVTGHKPTGQYKLIIPDGARNVKDKK